MPTSDDTPCQSFPERIEIFKNIHGSRGFSERTPVIKLIAQFRATQGTISKSSIIIYKIFYGKINAQRINIQMWIWFHVLCLISDIAT